MQCVNETLIDFCLILASSGNQTKIYYCFIYTFPTLKMQCVNETFLLLSVFILGIKPFISEKMSVFIYCCLYFLLFLNDATLLFLKWTPPTNEVAICSASTAANSESFKELLKFFKILQT